MDPMKRAIIAGLAMPTTPLPEFTPRPSRKFNWFGSEVKAQQAADAIEICARLREFYARRPRPWRTWRGSQRTGRKARSR